ncbi:hypothetical protein EMIHUDRAFT_228911 [Emiliania huxleyi CCMP1516]|uniref:3'-5' exonuclease domain-containing protein n=2 Tax=Emiliania huxleyi TaxID=2903 RepID=A0A0D3KE71_EMIH1|nr:hypothetical protein EMIHUDRAFT_228911 [Emiliania huxleyi CCMP1516]EOD34056.1 hypothetical protein EMIHUDRAFT_228911 [Emiliania huxleyi CCMP1516]|eukprot:XP_005786485.1 hypothetical protein EMIHUDRAFT_228911 [Emiliania huxleyi CCMP1516]
MLQAHGADAATWTVMGDDCISMGRSKGLPEDLLHELARNQAASTRRRDFRGDERAVRAQEEHAKHCSCCQRRRSEAGAGDEPPALEDAVVELAVALGAAAADSDEALSAALLSATGLDTPILRHAIEFSLRIAEQLLRAARDEALGRCLGKGAKGRARRPVRMVAGAVLAAVKSEGVVEALVLSGQSIGSLVAAADAHVAAALVVRWPASLCDAAVCERLWATLTRTGNGWHAAVGEVKARQKRYGGPRVAAWARALRWAATVGFEGWRPAACSLLDEAAACASLAHLLDALSTRGAEVVPPALAELLTDRYGEWPCAPRAAPSLAAAAAPAIAPPPPLDIESLPAATLEQAGTLPRGEQLSMARLCDMLAVHGRGAWVIDALGHPARRAVGELLRWALNGDPADDDAVAVLGFAFQGDLSVLRPICGGDLHARALVDLQQLARQGREDSQPSLRRVCARTLGKALDKAEQCSDWARRPLLPAQIRYAALDAAVLLDIHDALLKRGEARQDGAEREVLRAVLAASHVFLSEASEQALGSFVVTQTHPSARSGTRKVTATGHGHACHIQAWRPKSLLIA